MQDDQAVVTVGGVSTTFFSQAHVDAAVATAVAAVPSNGAPQGFVPTEAQVQAAVDAGIIAAFTPVTPAA